MSNTEYIIIPGTQRKVYENSVVVLFRLPDTKWILHCGHYSYNGVRQKGWYFSSIPSSTVMPVFLEDLVAMRVVNGPQPHPPGPHPPCPPHPPGPHPPCPPVPIPIIFTPEDKKMIDSAMITVESLEDRDRLSGDWLINGKIIRVNNVEGAVEYYEWQSENETWVPASLGYRYMTRDEIQHDLAGTIVDVVYSDSNGLLTLVCYNGDEAQVLLSDVAHSPTYEDYKIRIPVFGKPDLVIDIPKGSTIQSVEVVESYEIEPGVTVPALIITEEIDGHAHVIATDITNLYNMFQKLDDTSTIKMSVDSATSSLSAEVKISDMPSNILNVDRTGLYVDVSGKADKVEMPAGCLLVSDGLGGFTKVGNGVMLQRVGAMQDSDEIVPTGNVIAAAIQAAIDATIIDITEQLDALNTRVTALETRVTDLEMNAVGPGESDEVVTSTTSGVTRSGYTIGSDVLSGDATVLATDKAVHDAMSWRAM